jgi:hypothetical protein
VTELEIYLLVAPLVLLALGVVGYLCARYLV